MIVAVLEINTTTYEDNQMINLIQKARMGRTNALAFSQGKSKGAIVGQPPVVQFKSTRHAGPVPMISNPTQAFQPIWLH